MPSLIDILPELAGAATAIGVLIPVTTRFVKFLVRLSRALDVVLKEFQPNGGTSIKDSIHRIEHRQTEEYLRTRALLNDQDHPVFLTNEKGLFTWVNRAFMEATQRTLEDLKDSGWLTAVTIEDRDTVSEEWKTTIVQQREFDLTFTISDRDGHLKQVRGRATPLKERGELFGWVGSLRLLQV